jgi:hypothetical protein
MALALPRRSTHTFVQGPVIRAPAIGYVGFHDIERAVRPRIKATLQAYDASVVYP